MMSVDATTRPGALAPGTEPRFVTTPWLARLFETFYDARR
jgi:hypothetical protein